MLVSPLIIFVFISKELKSRGRAPPQAPDPCSISCFLKSEVFVDLTRVGERWGRWREMTSACTGGCGGAHRSSRLPPHLGDSRAQDESPAYVLPDASVRRLPEPMGFELQLTM